MFQFAQRDIDHCNRLLQALPAELVLDKHNHTHRVGRPNIKRFLAIDPSEAVRSDEMLPLLRARFDIAIQRPYGGNIFAWLFSHILFHFDDRPDLIDMVLREEQKLLAAGELQSHHILVFFEKRVTKGMPALF